MGLLEKWTGKFYFFTKRKELEGASELEFRGPLAEYLKESVKKGQFPPFHGGISVREGRLSLEVGGWGESPAATVAVLIPGRGEEPSEKELELFFRFKLLLYPVGERVSLFAYYSFRSELSPLEWKVYRFGRRTVVCSRRFPFYKKEWAVEMGRFCFVLPPSRKEAEESLERGTSFPFVLSCCQKV